ncbi:MAG TPA: carboxypeptidase-like regulatory domain-containing protein [Chitinophagaceae bacterium]|nr:carboxypeptidase-like regulatory domain-containing protein [Chitinophagaceae bacterium]
MVLGLCGQANAQGILKGKIYEAETDSVIATANVLNVSTKQTARSGKDGHYEITAAEGEKIIFSIAGFRPDTITITSTLLLTQHDVTLNREYISLKPVTVINSYEADSLARREYYKKIYNQPGITGRNTPSNGVGVVLSPLSFFSRESRQKRQLKKRLIKEEQEYYIDRAFPAEWVERLTGLHGDSLSLFIFRYRPSYGFCRKTDRDDMLIYINDKLKEFKKQNPAIKEVDGHTKN